MYITTKINSHIALKNTVLTMSQHQVTENL